MGPGADFSRISNEEGVHLSAVLQGVYIHVNEYGTEAAAATFGLMVGTTRPVEKVVITIDRPFLFAIVDKPTGTILFMGEVVDPR